MQKLVPVLAAWGLLISCAFSPVARVNFDRYYNQFPHDKTVQLSVTDAMAAAQSALQAEGYEIQAVTPELGTILTKNRLVATPDVCDCGTWNGDPVRGTADSALKLTFTSMGAATKVELEQGCGTVFKGQNLNGATTRQEDYRCASRGGIEREFWDKLDRIVVVRASK